MIATIKLNPMIQTIHNLELFHKKLFTMLTISDISLAPKEVSASETIMLYVFITWLPSFIVSPTCCSKLGRRHMSFGDNSYPQVDMVKYINVISFQKILIVSNFHRMKQT